MTRPFDPKFVTFDCYGTLIWWQMSAETKKVLADRLPADRADAFCDTFEVYRGDEVLGPWKPYRDVVWDALRRAAKVHRVAVTPQDADKIWAAIETWGPHADVPEGLAKLATRYPLVILSNATDSQITHNVTRLGAPFHAVLTSEQCHAYKPRLAAFEYMLEKLGCGPEDVVHVSSSLRYDLISANDLGIKNKVYVNRGYEPSTPAYRYEEIRTIRELPGLFGL